ncbi:MAG: zinc ABC transporter substrate-binding protein [Anaerolineales bacterium]|nr:zinc ABC transporter substrate-binding protein [Anaerolineales bacterium]
MQRNSILIFALLVLFAVFTAPIGAQSPAVVASTSWTGAFARAAGAGNVTVIAPLDLKHPPEYEIKPSDLDKVRGAKLVVFAGYEKFAQKLTETAGGEKINALKVTTENNPETIKQQAKLIADALGTTAAWEKWSKGFDAVAAQYKADVQKAYPNRKAIIHKMQRPGVEWLGWEIVGEFGPAEPSPAVVADLAKAGAFIVIDNYHNPVGQPIAESAKVKYVQLINFPGKDGTASIEDVYRYNARVLLSAVGQTPTTPGVDWALLGGAVVIGVVILGGILFFLRRAPQK